jgi:hypothetical protein
MNHIEFDIGNIYFNTATGDIYKIVDGGNGIPFLVKFDCKPNKLDSQEFEYFPSMEEQKIIQKARLIGRP